MASAISEDGPSAQSPQPTDPAEKLNGEGDLDYTITMNESEDDASSDASSNSLIKKDNGKTSSSIKVNGKLASDDDSQSSVSKDAKVNATDTLEKKNNGGDCELKDQAQDNGMEGDKSQDGEADVEKVSESKDERELVEEDQKDPVQDDQVPDETSKESKNAANDRQEDDDTCLCEPKDAKDKSDENETERQDSEVDLPDEQKDEGEVEGQDSVEKEDLQDGHKVDEEEDDDVVEIDESPEKQPVGKILEGSAKDKPPFIRVSNAPVSGANLVPYLNSLPGSSLLSSSGMQFVQVTPGVQASGLLYVPGTGNFQGSTSASVFSSAMASMNKIQSQGQHSSTSIILPQYQNMMPNQNRFTMSQYNQGIRSAMAAPPVLTNIPDKPTSSIGMIENIRWEVENHINIKPKYAKPNPKAELGHLAKWTFDLGSDMVKEFVYHDLVRIQHCRNVEGALSDKEKEDFVKLQEIDKELNQKVGHLKFKLNKSCKCGFKTELDNVLYNHMQHAHIERGGFFNCILCKFSTRQPNTFRFHMESVHGRPGFVENRPSFFECPLCPYETNYTNRLEQHKVRCQRQYREAFNLHPSCITGPEVNLCLENVFYFVFTRQFMNSIIPKTTTPVVSSTTKIRDIPSKEVTPVRNMQTRRGITTPAVTTLTSSSKQLAPKTPAQLQQAGTAAVKQQSQLGSALSRNFPVISSKIGTVLNQTVSPVYTSGRPQLPPQNQPQPPAPNQPNNGFEVCEICGGYVKDRKALRIHFYYAHRIDMPFGVFERPLAPLYCATCFARFWTAQGLQKHIEVHKNDMMGTTQTSNGVAGKCISCGHRVPNILMHMRMVHNRELRHYLAALMCIFCGSRFSTKKEVESHMGKMHGVIVKNSNVQGNIDKPQPANPMGPNSSFQQPKPSAPAQKPPPNTATPKGRGSGKMNRGSQCVLCNLTFPRNVDLTRHCMRVHHTCMKCGLVVVDKESLARHTCLHSASGMRTCQICKESGFHPAYYIKHMRDKHLRKCSVVLRHIDRAVVETMKRPITISDSEDEESSEKPTEPKCPKTDGDAEGKQKTIKIKKEPADDADGIGSAQMSSEKENASETEISITCVKKEEMDGSEKENAEIDEDQQNSDEKQAKSDKEDKKEGESDVKEENQAVDSWKDDFTDGTIETTDEPDIDSVPVDKACDDINSKKEDSAEECAARSEDAGATDSKLLDTQQDKPEGTDLVDDPDEKQDCGDSAEEQSDKLETKSSRRKRKIDSSEGEQDGPDCKSLRQNNQTSEDQDDD